VCYVDAEGVGEKGRERGGKERAVEGRKARDLGGGGKEQWQGQESKKQLVQPIKK